MGIKIRINSPEKLEALLQEVYDDACRQINLIHDKITELTESTPLVDTPIESKAKYAKAIHDYITDKDKAQGRKIEISKLMGEIIKHNGDLSKVLEDEGVNKNIDLDEVFKKLKESEMSQNNDNTTEEYLTNKKKK
jgi:hypothetical protein